MPKNTAHQPTISTRITLKPWVTAHLVSLTKDTYTQHINQLHAEAARLKREDTLRTSYAQHMLLGGPTISYTK